MSLQHGLHGIAEHEVGVADDAGGDFRRSVLAAGALGGQPLHELGFSDATQILGPARAIHGVALDEHGLGHVVPGAQIIGQLIQQIAVALPIPEVVVRVADGEVGFDGLFDNLSEPGFAGTGHCGAPLWWSWG